MKTKSDHFIEASLFTLKHELLFCLLISVSIALIYGQVVHHDFIGFDDQTYVAENPYVQQGLTTEGIKWAFSFQINDDVYTYWHPLTWLSHMTDITLFGNQPGYHHLINVLWHMLNTCLLFFIIHRTTQLFWLSALTASFFAVHPLNVETVAWISERKNLLSTFFWLLSIAAYVFYTRRPAFMKYLLLVIIFTTGLLAKPMLVTLPFVFLLLDYWPLNRISFNLISMENNHSFFIKTIKQAALCFLEKIPLLCIAILVSYSVTEALSDISTVIPFSRVPLSLRVENLLVSYVTYLGKLIWPFGLGIFYPFPKSLSLAQVTGSTLLLGCITVAVLGPLHNNKQFTVGWFWYLGTLIPVSGLIQAGLWPALADRWTYVPFIGIFISVSWIIQNILKKLKRKDVWLISFTIIIIFVLGFLSWRQVRHWQNSYTLFKHTVAVTSHNYVAQYNLAAALYDRGQFEEAINHLYEAVAIWPRGIEARTNLVNQLIRLEKHDEAKRVYEEGIRLQPNSFKANTKLANIPTEQNSQEETVSYLTKNSQPQPENSNAHFNLAKELAILGRTEEAIEHFLQVISIDPEHYDSLNNLALLHNQLGNTDLAISYFNRALVIAPENDQIHYNLAYSLAAVGQTEEAEKHFTKALDINPAFANAHNNLGILLAQQNRTEEAITHFNKALYIEPAFVDAHTNIGLIFLNLGNRDKALFHIQEAVRLNPENQRLKQLLHIVSPR